jgi:hypothetical protein
VAAVPTPTSSPADPGEPRRDAPAPPPPRVQRPALAWWLLIVPPMTLLGVLSASAAQAARWREATHLPLGQAMYQWIFGLALLAHAGEALHAWRLASATAHAPVRGGWCFQTLLLGYPSLRLLQDEVRASRRAERD